MAVEPVEITRVFPLVQDWHKTGDLLSCDVVSSGFCYGQYFWAKEKPVLTSLPLVCQDSRLEISALQPLRDCRSAPSCRRCQGSSPPSWPLPPPLPCRSRRSWQRSAGDSATSRQIFQLPGSPVTPASFASSPTPATLEWSEAVLLRVPHSPWRRREGARHCGSLISLIALPPLGRVLFFLPFTEIIAWMKRSYNLECDKGQNHTHTDKHTSPLSAAKTQLCFYLFLTTLWTVIPQVQMQIMDRGIKG